MRSTRRALVVWYMVLAGVGVAQEGPSPTFSLEAVAVEGSLLPEPVNSIRVGPGERLLAKIFLRDWSPNGEILRAYQAVLDPASFESGDKGTVQPTNYAALLAQKAENTGAAFIDDKDPRYVHSGLHIIPIVDTLNAPGYRWLTVLLNAEEGPVHPQDGTKYYLGTVELEASSDAEGTFVVKFVESPDATGLLNLQSEYMQGLQYEGLTVTVDPSLKRLMIRESSPPDGAIDARIAREAGASDAAPWDALSVTFNLDASDVSAADFTVADGSPSPPRIQNIDVNANEVMIALSSPIKPGRWTDVTYAPTGTRVRLGFLPGDVTNDARTDAGDLIALIEALNNTDQRPGYATDLDRDGQTTPSDLAALVDLISGMSRRGGERLAAGR